MYKLTSTTTMMTMSLFQRAFASCWC